VASQAAWHGYHPDDTIVMWKPLDGEHTLRVDQLKEILHRDGERIAMILLGGVNYYTGQYFNIPEITALGHQYGITVGWDLAHAAGNVDLDLHTWNVDFAAWCSYKYLNSGPGSLGGVFIHERLALDLRTPRLSGWWGHNKETRFGMRDDFDPLPGAEGWQLSNPPILPLATMRASMELFDAAGMKQLREASKSNARFLFDALRDHPKIQIITPENPAERGCQLSLLVRENGRMLFDQLSRAGIIADWREPDVIRIAPVPLYNHAGDLSEFVRIMASFS
jgi:kynureninase